MFQNAIKVNSLLSTYTCYFGVRPLGASRHSYAVTDIYNAKLDGDVTSPMWPRQGMAQLPCLLQEQSYDWGFPLLLFFVLVVVQLLVNFTGV